MRRWAIGFLWLVFWFIVGLALGQVLKAQPVEFIQSFTIGHQETWDSKEIQFFELKSAQGNLLVSGDKQLPLSKFLGMVKGQRVIVTIEVQER